MMTEEDKKPLISIIVPIYNVASYLRECLDSLIYQTYSNLELILVDDGSTDGSSAICDEYVQKDSRITLIKKANGGLSSARNAGMAAATGELIGFVDADDYCDPTMYEKLLEQLFLHNADISMCGWYRVDEKDTHRVFQTDFIRVLNHDEALDELFCNKTFKNHVWNKLFKRSLVSEIHFPEGMFHEDIAISHEFFRNAQRVIFTSEPLYYYRQRMNSITATISAKRILDYGKAVEFKTTSHESIGREHMMDNYKVEVACQITTFLNQKMDINEKEQLISMRKKMMDGTCFVSLDVIHKIKYMLLKLFPKHFNEIYAISKNVYHLF